MKVTRTLVTVVLAAGLGGGLSGCGGSTGTSGAAAAASPSASVTMAPAATIPSASATVTASPTATATAAVACVPITSLNAPKASAAASARIKFQKDNLVALVDQAAHDRDYALLDRLSGCKPPQPGDAKLLTYADLQDDSTLDALATVLENTHGAFTDGFQLPGFTFGGTNPAVDAADMAALHVSGKTWIDGRAAYQGLIAQFDEPSGRGSCGCTMWHGARWSNPLTVAGLPAKVAPGSITVFTVSVTNHGTVPLTQIAPVLTMVGDGPGRAPAGKLEVFDAATQSWTAGFLSGGTGVEPNQTSAPAVDVPGGQTVTFKLRLTAVAGPMTFKNGVLVRIVTAADYARGGFGANAENVLATVGQEFAIG